MKETVAALGLTARRAADADRCLRTLTGATAAKSLPNIFVLKENDCNLAQRQGVRDGAPRRAQTGRGARQGPRARLRQPGAGRSAQGLHRAGGRHREPRRTATPTSRSSPGSATATSATRSCTGSTGRRRRGRSATGRRRRIRRPARSSRRRPTSTARRWTSTRSSRPTACGWRTASSAPTICCRARRSATCSRRAPARQQDARERDR